MDIEKMLKAKDLKITPQRKAILCALIEAKSIMSAQEIFQEVIRLLPGINFSTVYRNLDIMLSKGLLCRISSESGAVMYELRREDGHHHHVICKECGASISLDFCPMERINAQLAEKGFTPTEHRFEIYGYCSKCRNK